MFNGLVKIMLRSVSDASGWNDQTDRAKKFTAQINGLSGAARKLGTAFGTVGGIVGSALANVLKGGIWGVAADGAKLAVHWVGKLWNKFKEVDEELVKAQQRVIDAQAKQLGVLVEVQRKAADERRKAIEESTKQYKAELDSVHNLTRATLELRRAQARKAGDQEGVASIDSQIAQEDAATERAKLERALSDAKARKNDAAIAYNEASARRARAIRQINSDRYDLGVEKNPELRKALRGSIGVAAGIKIGAEKDAAKESESYRRAVQEIKRAKESLAAFDLRQQANLENSEAEAREKNEAERKKEAEDIKNFEAEKKRLEKSIADERRKLQIEAAKERERLDREAHQKRMADLRDEIAKQKEVAAPLRTVAAAAQSEFDRAFAMYRDPSRAAAEIGEEKDYQNDLERLHRDARQYGGKWRIDELSRLMSAGDTQGVTDALNSWRKTKGFTPEVEAMVRASVAEKTKTTAEDELRKVNEKVASMSDVLKQMADSQSGKLGTIADSTSGLAEKIDQLLKVKG